ncbi:MULTISPECIES: virulence protein RhuM/Fic/DOC family protein [unclassified Siphonobacter]|uniref:virulence protein RhuM/Fic/DOC family protein n=1 Tax=unclassified Siphonobacter TaxID=2635712 RepID=UPI000CC8D9C7|nr:MULTISPECIES: virulence protein RhuM/Fic/DOC family protein [unclassified Siphonobacter]MDQ1086702.1 prophage maintenance system killer protein [Siphonobacter sp. SORGH_AS_1065]PKK36214.1 death-on-curing protein [Siphonobacter sp. SORGH_AS_0500]
MDNPIEIYQSSEGDTQIEVKFEEETVWLNRMQMAHLFDRDVKTIGKHINNVFQEAELIENAVVAKFATTAADGKTYQIEHYNLDLIISVGYRVKSRQGTRFRQWATQRLKEYLIQGYALNEKRLEQKQQQIQTLKEGIRILSRAIESKSRSEEIQWLSWYSTGLELLDDYDHERLDKLGLTKRPAVYPDLKDYFQVIDAMRTDFESAIFGKEKDQGFQSATLQIAQGFGETDFYPSIEEKAATLLYLIVKNHAFVDGNKRIAAACFLLFLNENEMLYTKNGFTLISNEALASLTLFIASSKPEEMETVKKLIISVLNRNQKNL